ncbi:MAG: hypothetical protein M1840_008498 [Geoglossum simile]|nr:MAG: hypothetical protein M1840_008498 [Geoglossum simile]
MPLCGYCDRFDLKRFAAVLDGHCFTPLQRHIDGFHKQCDFCRLLINSFSDSAEWLQKTYKNHLVCMTIYASNAQIKGPKDVKKGLGITSLEATLCDGRKKTGVSRGFVIAAEKASAAASSGTVRGRFLGADSSSEEHCAAISEWVNECQSHVKCSEAVFGTQVLTHDDNPLPTRCLKVTQKGVRLVETRGKRGSYLILSHRWGVNTKSCSTTADNVDNRLLGKDFYDLTPNLLDAIDMTRKLQYSYIWIDSLCIIQSGDGGKDWRTEILNMADYYQHASFTLFSMCKDDSEDPNPDGMLFARKTPIKFLARLPFLDFDGKRNGHVYLYYRPWSELPFRVFKSAVLQNPMLRRGWVFQEWFLSRRILYISATGLFFECLEEYPRAETRETVEANPSNDSDSDSESDSMEPKSSEDKRLPHSFKTTIVNPDLPIESTWYKLLEMYTSMNLTEVEKDRGLAIAGIAKYVRDILMAQDDKRGGALQRYEYVSGLWLRDLHHGLLWLKGDDSEAYAPLNGFPTWSWLSNSNAIRWNPIPTAKQRERSLPAITVTRLYSDEILETCFRISEPSGDGTPLITLDETDQSYVIGPFNVDNAFTGLEIVGRRTALLVRKPLKAGEGKLVQRITAGYDRLSDFLMDSLSESMYDAVEAIASIFSRDMKSANFNLYEVCDPSNPKVLCGWASIETPHIRSQLSKYYGTSLVALHVSTQKEVLGGYSSGKLGLRHDVYNVLFVEALGGDRNLHRRVGMGRVFDKAILSLFQTADEAQILLI